MSQFIRLGRYVAIHPKHNILMEYKPREFMCKITMPSLHQSLDTSIKPTTYYVYCDTMKTFDQLLCTNE